MFTSFRESILGWEVSTITPGETAFYSEEECLRLCHVVMRLMPATAMFERFCVDFKRRIEAMVAKKGGRETFSRSAWVSLEL